MTDTVTLIRSPNLADTAEYAYAATASAGARLIFLAGSCPLDDTGATVGVGDYAAQAHQAMENLVTALAAAGATLENVLSTGCWWRLLSRVTSSPPGPWCGTGSDRTMRPARCSA
jgi:enamine deaminase RidA (YjgF/YER057c/UK114 family)